MLSKSRISLIDSMSRKKGRDNSGLFLAEGQKLVSDLINAGMKLNVLVATKHWSPNCDISRHIPEPEIVPENDFKKLSHLKTPQNVLALFEQPDWTFDKSKCNNDLILGLDGIQDPGNMGTILRIADWFGIYDVVCSVDTADVFNPKVVQATMGAIARVRVHYLNLEQFCEEYKSSGNQIYGTFLEGDNIYSSHLEQKGLIIIGNEGNGIRPEIEKIVSRKITIPSFSKEETCTESLNAGVAAAIVCSEFRRKRC